MLKILVNRGYIGSAATNHSASDMLDYIQEVIILLIVQFILLKHQEEPIYKRTPSNLIQQDQHLLVEFI